MKVTWNKQECEVIEETEKLYALEVVSISSHRGFYTGILVKNKSKQIVWVRKEWIEEEQSE